MRLLQINVTANWGSTGKIAEEIGNLAIEQGWESWIAYGRGKPKSSSNLIRVGNDRDMKIHGIQSRLFDNHGLASQRATKEFIRQIRVIKPTLIHLHNIHGYYLYYPALFTFLKEYGAPVVWTLHDCWAFTGHCAYYDYAKCLKWQTSCYDCPQKRSYPASIWLDRSEKNFMAKKKAFLGVRNITLVPVSEWLRGELAKSFLSGYHARTIHNGIDLSVFTLSQVSDRDEKRKVILGVANVWDKRKGLEEFVKLRRLLSEEYLIILVGLSQKQISTLPAGITGIRRTENVRQLADLYSMADVFVNPTLEDNFPTTNLEAGGSPEAIDDKTGIVVPYRDVETLAAKVKSACESSTFISGNCRQRAESLFDKHKAFKEYINLYKTLLNI